MELIFALCLGITLSAACGFRIFIPPLIMSAASLHGSYVPAPEFAWLATETAFTMLAIASAVEVFAYMIPAVDNLLDMIEIPTAIAIGTGIVGMTLTDLDPLLQWTIAVIAGGGTAGLVDGMTAVTRLATTTLTGGLANPAVGLLEALSAAVLALIAIVLPLWGITLVAIVGFMAYHRLARLWQKRQQRLAKLEYNHYQ
ncbi:MAG: DUF4126 domain-containing protein [Spirulina sp. SIO3F2]|nr:DUF4126 domain-containing protein [Spirulina sp. SIO3F2]